MIERLKNWLLKGLFCTVDIDQVITQNKLGLLFINNEQISIGEVQSLKEEIKFIKSTRLWRILTESLRDQAHKIMFEKSTTFDDMKSGKMMLYNLRVQENILKIIEEYKLK